MKQAPPAELADCTRCQPAEADGVLLSTSWPHAAVAPSRARTATARPNDLILCISSHFLGGGCDGLMRRVPPTVGKKVINEQSKQYSDSVFVVLSKRPPYSSFPWQENESW